MTDDTGYRPLDLNELFDFADLLRGGRASPANDANAATAGVRTANAAELLESHRGRSRVRARGEDLEVVDGLLIIRRGGASLELARPPSGRVPTPGDELVITSDLLSVRGGSLIARCSGRCGGEYPMRIMGLRWVSPLVIRNQPQCPACRHQRIPRTTPRLSRTNRAPSPLAPRALEGVIEATEEWDAASEGMSLDEVDDYLRQCGVRTAGATP